MNEALEELKRVDHLIYVSLKYTRTVDVIVNILGRMVDGYAFMVDALLELARERGKYSGEPESAIERAELVRELYGKDMAIADNMGLYLLLRKLLRARNVARENEYRRHVTMKTVVEGREEIVNIDIITNYYMFQREFLAHVKSIVDGKVEVEIEESRPGSMAPPDWGQEEEMPRQQQGHAADEQQVTHRTPPKKNTLKVRPVGSPPRKRAPRPKKYKIQIPKGKNSITLPYEYDPHFRKEMEKEKARLKTEADAKEKVARAAARKAAAPTRAARKARPVARAKAKARPAKKAAARKPARKGKKK